MDRVSAVISLAEQQQQMMLQQQQQAAIAAEIEEIEAFLLLLAHE